MNTTTNRFIKGLHLLFMVVLLGPALGLSLQVVQAADCVPYDSFTNRTKDHGLGHWNVNGVYASGSTVYAATIGGLSISTDGGSTFTNKTTADGLGYNNVNGVHASGSTVYASTSRGLSISTDGGNTFTNKTTADGLGDDYVNGVCASGSTVYAATQGGLSTSTDGGNTFIDRTTADGLGSNSVRGVYASGSTVYAATGWGLSISTDGGNTFTNKTPADGLGHNIVYDIYTSGGMVYAATPGGLSIGGCLGLTANVAGSGTGTVTSDPAGIDCGADCTEVYSIDTLVTLTADPGDESHFAGWSGDCSGSDSTAAVTMGADKTCIATFGHTWRVYLPLVTNNTPSGPAVQGAR